MKNQQVSEHLRYIAQMKSLNKEGNFRVLAYQNAAQQIDMLADDLETLDLFNIPGIGKSIAKVIKEYLETGSSQTFQELNKKFPVEALTMTVVSGVGPKKAMALYEMGYKNFEALLKAAQDQILDPKLRDAVLFANSKVSGRIPYSMASAIAFRLKDEFRSIPGILDIEVAGSVRREMPTVKDIDIAICVNSDAVRDEVFKYQSSLGQNFSGKEAKGSVLHYTSPFADGRNTIGIQIDCWIGRTEYWGTLLNHCTGSKDHNVALRTRAKTYGYSVSEYGIFDSLGKQIGGSDEGDLYKLLNLPYIYPKDRNGILP